MFGKKESKPHGRIDSLIAAGTRVEGSIRFAGGLRVDGEVHGNIEAAEGAAASTLVISELASVEGAVRVEHLVTNGTVVGPVEVGGSLEMQPKSRIVGDVGYLVIEMHQGAVIEGKLIHRGPGSAELPAAGQVS